MCEIAPSADQTANLNDSLSSVQYVVDLFSYWKKKKKTLQLGI